MRPDNKRCVLDSTESVAAATELTTETGDSGTVLVLEPVEADAGTLRLNANLDFGTLVERSSSRVLLKAFSC